MQGRYENLLVGWLVGVGWGGGWLVGSARLNLPEFQGSILT